MADTLRFIVPMRPVAKERPRVGKQGQVYTPRKTREFEAAVGWYALQARRKAGWEMLTGPVQLDVTFVGPPARADLSNLVKSLEDAMNGVLWSDDSLIIAESVRLEREGKPRIEVEVTPVEGAGAEG